MVDSSPTSICTDDLAVAARAFVPDASECEAIQGHPDIVKVQSSTGTRKVRQWPAAATHGDLAFGHEVISAARDSGLETVPAVLSLPDSNETVLRIGTCLFDAQDWLPGQPPPRAETFWPEAGLARVVIGRAAGSTLIHAGFAAALGGLVIYKHRGNVKRILQGTEPKIRLGKKDEAPAAPPGA